MNAQRRKALDKLKNEHPDFTLNIIECIAKQPEMPSIDHVRFGIKATEQYVAEYLASGDFIKHMMAQLLELMKDFEENKNHPDLKGKSLKYFLRRKNGVDELAQIIRNIKYKPDPMCGKVVFGVNAF